MGRNNKDFSQGKDWAVEAAYLEGAKDYNVHEWADTLRREAGYANRARVVGDHDDSYFEPDFPSDQKKPEQ